MKAHTAAQLAALRNGPTVVYLVEFTIGDFTYRFCDSDYQETFENNTYFPSFLLSVDDIEVTAEPKTNDTSITLDAADNTLVTALLTKNWMNKPFKATKLILDNNGALIISKSVFQGFLTDYSINEANSQVELSAASVWADFEKTAGVKSNLSSQQRYFPNDTAGRHASAAIEKVYWGKETPETSSTSSSSGGGNTNWPVPTAREN